MSSPEGPHPTLPLASMYAAVCRSVPAREPEPDMQRRATTLTNELLARGDAIETNAIADRVALVHASLIPALRAAVRRGGGPTDVDVWHRLVDDAHVAAAASIGVEAAAAQLVERYLDGARFATLKQLAKIFGFLSPDEITAALERLGRKVEIVLEGRTHLAIRRV